MDSKDPDELITEVQEEQQTRGELAKDALQWFLDGNVGELFPRDGVVKELSEELDINPARANVSISDTVGDIVDPVQQITRHNEKYVGVIDYKVFSDEGAYGYVDFDDRKGKRKRVVCARCVEKHKYDENITHATQGEGSSKPDATWQQLLNKVTSHYADVHTKSPSTIEPGASLVSGTTISGNTSWHDGNVSGNDGISIGSTSVGLGGGALGRVNVLSFNNIEDPSIDRSLGADDSEGLLFKDSSGTTYPQWSNESVNAGSNISINGGTGAGSTPVTLSVSQGSGSGLDADTLDGNQASDFYVSDGNTSFIVETRSSDPSNPSTGRIWMLG